MVNAKKLENWSVPWTIVKWVLRGVYDRGIKELASLSSQDLHGRNASPNLYRFIHKKNRTLPIAISAVKIPVKVRKPSQVISKQWPVLHLSSWLRTCMTDPNYGGFFSWVEKPWTNLMQYVTCSPDFGNDIPMWMVVLRPSHRAPQSPSSFTGMRGVVNVNVPWWLSASKLLSHGLVKMLSTTPRSSDLNLVLLQVWIEPCIIFGDG